MPAQERYLGTHVESLRQIAEFTKFPFYILSGIFGLIEGKTRIPYYDHQLQDGEVKDLASKIESQIRKAKIKKITFYTKAKPEWQPYRKAMEIACADARINLEIEELDDNA